MGIAVDDIRPTASGATAGVWQIRSSPGTFAFRLSRRTNRETPIDVDTQLPRHLHAMGETAILDPLCDFGSFCYFHEPESTSALLDGYATGPRRPDLALIKSFSAAIALHLASRSRLPGKAHRLDVAARHVATL